MKDDYLAHYGIKGMKWGVRRFQNADGSLTAAGKKRYGSEESFESSKKIKTKVDGKKLAKAALMAASVAGAAYVYSRNKKAIDRFVTIQATRVFTKAEKTVKEAPSDIANRLDTTKKMFSQGVREGITNAPKQFGRALGEGAAYMAGMYAVGKLIGGARVEDLIKSYNAYNKKNKIGKVTSIDDFIRNGHYTDSKDKDEDD